MAPIVRVAQGTLQGKECIAHNGRKYYSFEGIPYAKPPVGKLRFRDPQEPENWTGTLDATKPGNKCPQMDPYGSKGFEGSEDCLYLNIYTPSLPREKIENLPVLFFVHGGRFIVGYGDYYRPDYFFENDVILVTINYRLHILGFLCLHIPEAPGNAAFKDTVMALKWVKKNIGQFNGDMNNVTAFGESAGGGVVTSYITSKMADGLVDKIIGQSGVSLSDLLMIEEDPIEKAKNIATILGKEFDNIQLLYDFLLNAPVEDLILAAGTAEITRPSYIINAYFLPVIEKKYEGIDRFFEEYPLITMLQNRYTKIPMLIGLNSHEGALFLQKDDEGNIIFVKDLQRLLPRFLSLPYDSTRSIDLGRKLKEYYFKDRVIGTDTKEEYVNMMSDVYFNRDIVTLAEKFSKYSDKLYFYYFNYSGNMNTRIMRRLGLKGASHGDIIQYEFYRESKAKDCNENDEKIVKFISDAWCSFAKTGKPTWTNQSTEWLPYTQEKRISVNIDKEISVGPLPIWDRIKFWLDHMGERSKL